MAAGAHCLRLVRNAVSSSRTFVHAGSVVVVPIQLTLWKITHVWSLTAFPSIFCLCMNRISVCVYSVPSLLCVFCGCGGLASKTYGWQWLIRRISVFFRKYSHFFSIFKFVLIFQSHRFQFILHVIRNMEWRIEIPGIKIMKKF